MEDNLQSEQVLDEEELHTVIGGGFLTSDAETNRAMKAGLPDYAQHHAADSQGVMRIQLTNPDARYGSVDKGWTKPLTRRRFW